MIDGLTADLFHNLHNSMIGYWLCALGSVALGFVLYACMPSDSEKLKKLQNSKQDLEAMKRNQALMDAMKRAAGIEPSSSRPKSDN